MANTNLYHFPPSFQEFESDLKNCENAAYENYIKVQELRNSWQKILEDQVQMH